MRRQAVVVALWALAACNQVFGLEPTLPLADAAVADEDRDGEPDVTDNCPHIANDQSDKDSDEDGDVCDTCPLFANADQADFDGDGIGDVCDPVPTAASECLILFDDFSNEQPFETRWRTLMAANSGATLEPGAGFVKLRPQTDDRFAIVALGADGAPLTGTFDVEVVGHAKLTTGGKIHGTSRLVDRNTGYLAGVEGRSPRDLALIDTGPLVIVTEMSTTRFGDSFAIQMRTENPAQLRPLMRVRVDYGIAVGTLDFTSEVDVPVVGMTGIVAQRDDVDVEGFIAYRRQAPPCPPPLLR